MAIRTLDQWRNRLEELERSGGEVGTVSVSELIAAVRDLVEIGVAEEVWRASAGHWETAVQEVTEQLERDRVDFAEREQVFQKRIDELDASVRLSAGDIDPTRKRIANEVRSHLLRRTEGRIDELAHAAYSECMREHGLEDCWEIESPVRRRGFGITMEVVLKILERELSGEKDGKDLVPRN